MNKKRLATFTVEVPLKFTFAADNDLQCQELHEAAVKELNKRLKSGFFDVLDERLEVVDKITHYTLEEKREINRRWQEMLWGIK